MKTLNEIIKTLEEYKSEAEALAKAWTSVKINKKKNGEEFARISQAIEGAYLGKYTPVEDGLHPYLTIYARTEAGKYINDNTQAYFYLDELPDTDERKKAYFRQLLRQTTPQTANELRKTIKETAEKWTKRANNYAEQIKKAPTAYENYRKATQEAEKQLKADTLIKDKYPNSLYYLIKEV